MDAAHEIGARGYALTWGALLGLTGLTFGLSFAPLGPLEWPVALAIAATKAVLVALFFMHLRTSRGGERLAIVVAALFVALLCAITALDAVTR
jgi:cytochrome c oxidase subunit 4